MLTRLFHFCVWNLFSLIASLGLSAFAAAEVPTWPQPELPKIPERDFDITRFGAVADGKTPATEAVKKAIAAASEAGGGVVRVPSGSFLTGPFSLASRINLHLDSGAKLLLINDLESYPRTEKTYVDWITASNCTDVAITGQGTIDGQGKPWWDKYRKQNGVAPVGLLHRPQMIVLDRCTRVLVKDVTLINSPNFHLVPGACREVTIDHVTITAPVEGPNTDAIDPSGWNFRIANCNISVGDDNIAIKPTSLIEPGKPSCQNFLVENCVFGTGHGMSIGGQTRGGLKNLVVRNCTFEGTETGIRMKAPRGNGGLVENCHYLDLTMKNVKVPIFITSYYPKVPKDVEQDVAQEINERTPIWRNIRIENVTVTGSDEVGRIVGVAEMPIQGIRLTNVNIAAQKGLRVVYARGIEFLGCQIQVESGDTVMAFDAEVKGLRNP